MSDRNIQVSVLVVLVAILTVAVLTLAKVPGIGSGLVVTALVGMIASVIGGMMALIARPSNNVPREPPDSHVNS